MDNDLEYAAKAKQEFLRDINVLQSQSQSHDLNSMERAFQLLKDPQTTGFEGGCCNGLLEHPKGRLFAMSKNDFRHKNCISKIQNMLVSPMTYEPLNIWGFT